MSQCSIYLKQHPGDRDLSLQELIEKLNSCEEGHAMMQRMSCYGSNALVVIHTLQVRGMNRYL